LADGSLPSQTFRFPRSLPNSQIQAFDKISLLQNYLPPLRDEPPEYFPRGTFSNTLSSTDVHPPPIDTQAIQQYVNAQDIVQGVMEIQHEELTCLEHTKAVVGLWADHRPPTAPVRLSSAQVG
jgi:hypothetical protein